MTSSRTRKPTEPTARLGFLLYRSGLAIARGYERALKPIDASPTDAGVLSALAYSGPNHTRGLARMLGLGRQTIVNVTKRLEDSGLIARNASDRDGRLAVFAISKKGSTRLAEIEVIASGFDGQLSAIVGAANEQGLVETLQRILAAPMLTHEE
jgi:DNA-binding MarR family transcriptional regulator